MNRRGLILGVSTLTTGGAFVSGTGAFSQTQASRSVSIETADDDEAYLSIVPLEPDFAETNQEGLIEFGFDDSFFGNPEAGDGLNTNAEFVFLDVFGLENTGDQPVKIFSKYDSGSPDNKLADVRVTNENGRKLIRHNPSSALGPGNSGRFGMFIDTSGVSASESFETTVEIIAASEDSEKYPNLF